MNKIILSFALSICTFLCLQGQIMHSSNAMEYSVGLERFSQFIAKELNASNQENTEIYRSRPIFTGRFKRFCTSEDYFAFGMQITHSSWVDEILAGNFIDFTPSGEPVLFPVFERNRETKFGVSFQYAFLLNKKAKGNARFFIGAIVDWSYSSARKRGTSRNFIPAIDRGLTGLRLSAVPEFMYFIPNSRVIVSLRLGIPVGDYQKISEELRDNSSSFRSFERVESTHFLFVPVRRSSFEFGLGYFLK